jgi:GT2 family glycosyltransferase
MYRRDALEAMAPQGAAFEARFFAYYEDVDLSLRLSREGWRFLCDPAAVARHEGSRTGMRTPFRRALWTCRNRWRTLFRNFTPAFLARNLVPLLRADLAHARELGWAGLALPMLVWPRLPVLALRHRRDATRLRAWPRAATGAAADDPTAPSWPRASSESS